jgi:predicted flap endonuclease-1-like 5' DNA nuclease
VRPTPTSVRPGAGSSPEALAAELAQTQRVLASKLAELSKLSTERGELLARIAERDQRITERDARLRELPGIVAQRDGLKKQVHSLDGRVRELETTQIEVAALRSALRERERELAKQSQSEANTSAGGLEQRVTALEAELANSARRIRELESELQDALAWSPPSTDDLTRIRGIGPSFQKKLSALGIDKFAQIAAWTPERAEEIARALKIAPTRITRDGWIESARTLLRGG